MGFEEIKPEATGRPAYHLSTLLKIYIYGYLNPIQSTRRREMETQRYVELMWLTSRLTPDFKTMARFRKDNGKAIRSVCRQFVELCRQLDLFSQEIAAIDGSKFQAINNRDKNFTSAKIDCRNQQLKDSIYRYLATLDSADQEELAVIEAKTVKLKKKIVGYNVQTAVDTKNYLIVAHEGH